MKHLVYCILRDPPLIPESLPNGLEGGPVCLFTAEGLAAAHSPVADACANPTLARVRAFAGVVEAFHEKATVLPMRYGCLLDQESQLRELLGKRRLAFRTDLERLQGCIEMGLRILLDEDQERESAGAKEPFLPAPVAPSGEKAKAISGTAYLTARKAYFAAIERQCEAASQIAQGVVRAFTGLYRQEKVDLPAAGANSVLSMFFLVHRDHLDSFRQAFRGLQQSLPQKMLLSGPWPPYSFVTSEPPY